MDYDLLVRRGRVVDGSGLPSFIADVGVRDGKVAEVGKLKGTATRTIDADGLAVAPGFIDHHTHLDAQMLLGSLRHLRAAARYHYGRHGQLRIDSRPGEKWR